MLEGKRSVDCRIIKNKIDICTHICILHFQSSQAEISGTVLNYTLWFFTEHFTSLARLWPPAPAAQGSSPLMVRRCRAPQCRFVLACPRERDSRCLCVRGCVFSDCGSSFFRGDGLIPASFSLTHFACADTPCSHRACSGHML